MNLNITNRIELLEEYIRNISEKKSSDLISSKVLYSYRHANRLFKSLKGESIQSYSKKIRLGIGAEYLKYTSRSIFDIAIDCGYESTAAFSKAFKGVYKESPLLFRENNNFIHLLKNSIPRYSIIHLKELTVQTLKMQMPSDIDFDGYFKNTKSILNNLKIDITEWMLLWDEDPKLTQVTESIYHLGFNLVNQKDKNFKSTKLNGRYLIFDTNLLKEHPYGIWHELACAIIERDKLIIREAPYIEYFSKTSLKNATTFFPYKIAIPIQ